MVNQCPHCGTWLPQHIQVGGRARKKIYEYIRTHPGCNMDAIVWHVYGSDPNGGPEDPANTIRTIICLLRKILAKHGWAIENRRGVGTTYRIVPLKSRERPTDGATKLSAILP